MLNRPIIRNYNNKNLQKRSKKPPPASESSGKAAASVEACNGFFCHFDTFEYSEHGSPRTCHGAV